MTLLEIILANPIIKDYIELVETIEKIPKKNRWKAELLFFGYHAVWLMIIAMVIQVSHRLVELIK